MLLLLLSDFDTDLDGGIGTCDLLLLLVLVLVPPVPGLRILLFGVIILDWTTVVDRCVLLLLCKTVRLLFRLLVRRAVGPVGPVPVVLVPVVSSKLAYLFLVTILMLLLFVFVLLLRLVVFLVVPVLLVLPLCRSVVGLLLLLCDTDRRDTSAAVGTVLMGVGSAVLR